MSSSPWRLCLRRCVAFVYDALLLTAMFFVLTAVFVLLNDGEATRHPVYYASLYVTGFLFYCWCWQRGGQTLGMQAWRLRLHSENGASPTTFQCAIRYVSFTALPLVGTLWMLVDSEALALQDRFSDTRIARE